MNQSVIRIGQFKKWVDQIGREAISSYFSPVAFMYRHILSTTAANSPLAERGDDADALLTVHRPWGTYRALHNGHRVHVRYITVNPGSRLALQIHHDSANHWVIVQGTARIARGNEEMILAENQSIYIPPGTAHRLENPGKIPLQMIEVQSSIYLREDDIVRVSESLTSRPNL
jgi:mannose-6-phosphate isomerase-like protein (cupin superfamily)